MSRGPEGTAPPGGTVLVILAAGKGVRMRSSRPKLLHDVAGTPILERVLKTARDMADVAPRTVLVVGPASEALRLLAREKSPEVALAVQDPPRGTGDALRAASKELGDARVVAVVPGDAPLLAAATVRRVIEARERAGASVAFLTARLPRPSGYGRVVRDAGGAFTKIVEEKDATDAERAIDEVNAGVYAFERGFVDAFLATLGAQNAQNEVYLTDLLAIAVTRGEGAVAVPSGDFEETLGINSRADLARVEAIVRRRAAERAMDQGATLVRPETVTLDESVVLAPDVVLEPFVTLLGATSVGEGTRIGQGSVITSSVLGRGVVVKPYSVLESARVGDGGVVGPFARLREGTELAEGVHVGNFVETKKAVLARGVKANHLTYLGDCAVGERTNVGAGVITCNYDGFTKNRTTIGADVFVGSDTQLVAPVAVGDGAVIAAGTTVTDDVPADALSLSRAPQKNVDGGGARYRQKKKPAVKRPGTPAPAKARP